MESILLTLQYTLNFKRVFCEVRTAETYQVTLFSMYKNPFLPIKII